ncbi:MAG TPA: glycosyltransferase family 4 protein [Usitatibacteraceae bacterium]|nr:glycosyltransferase family 4 protein [Usitatibacteraceae bacterium]
MRSRYDAFGGAERFVQSAVAALSVQGASFTLVTRGWPDGDGSAIVLDPFYVGSLWRDRGFARAVCAELPKRHFDLVQSHERIACCDVYRAGDGVHATWLAERARIQSPLARLATSLSPHHRYLLAAERELFTSPRLRAVICNSEMVRGEIAQRFATPAEKLVLIRNAVDIARFHPGLREEVGGAVREQVGIPRAATVFAFVGSGFERKGVRAFLSALARRREAAWAIVVGKDKRTARYQRLAARLGIGARVRFVGGVSDVRPYLAAADAFVLPTLYDPLPNAVLEAMAAGLPVVTSTKCGAAELIADGVTGFVHDALDVDGITRSLDRLDPGTARTMGEAARLAVAHLTPDSMGREYLALYERLLADKLG